MSLTLHVDGDRWRAHLRSTVDRNPGIVPVAKGNGYGFGLGRLARRTQWLGLGMLAVGTYDELPEVAERFDGDLLVLTPWRPHVEAPAEAHGRSTVAQRRVVHTISRPADLPALLERHPGARFVLEQLTSMRRHGMTRRELEDVVAHIGDGRLEGVAMHLPLGVSSHVSEVTRLLNDVVAAGVPSTTVFVSHLTATELERLRAAWPDFTIRPRIGTDLWLGERAALRVSATVLDVHEVERGDLFGYRGRSAPKHGHLVVVSGGTAHGIGLEAPTGDQSLKARAATLARGGMDAVGFVRSPFSVDGKQRLFAEPPHMQASMLFVPAGARVPQVGEEIDVRVRYTATDFDRTLIS